MREKVTPDFSADELFFKIWSTYLGASTAQKRVFEFSSNAFSLLTMGKAWPGLSRPCR
jgi:hypothetical protein